MRLMLADEVRARLADLANANQTSLAELSRILGRSDGYMSRYLGESVPYVIADGDRRRLSRYFGVDEVNLRPMPARRPRLTWKRARG